MIFFKNMYVYAVIGKFLVENLKSENLKTFINMKEYDKSNEEKNWKIIGKYLSEIHNQSEQKCSRKVYITFYKHYNEALRKLEKAPLNVENLSEVAFNLQMLNREKEAIVYLKHAENIEPNNPYVLDDLAHVYKKIGHNDLALKYAHSARKSLAMYTNKKNQSDPFLLSSIEDKIREMESSRGQNYGEESDIDDK